MATTALPNVTTTACPPEVNSTEFNEEFASDFYGYIIVCGPLCIIGFVLNILCVAVLGKDKSKVSTSFFLRMLALADNGLLTVVFMTKTLPTCGRYFRVGIINAYMSFFTKSIAFTNAAYEIIKMYAVLMVVLVTIDRSIAVFLPLQASHLCTMKVALIEVVLLGLYVIVFNLPRFFEFESLEVWDECSNETVVTIRGTDLVANEVYTVVYNNLDSAINLIIPVVLVCILNIGLVVRVTMARKSRMRMATNQRANSNTSITMNLVGVVTAFVVCETPIAIITIMTAFDMQFDKPHAHIWGDCFQTLGSFINFFIYCLTGRKFRRILMREVCCGRKTNRMRMSSWNRMGASTSKYSKDSVMTVSVTNF